MRNFRFGVYAAAAFAAMALANPVNAQPYGYGPVNYVDLKLSTDQVKRYLQPMIRNSNLTVGDVIEKDADTIVADVVSKQGNSPVQKLYFNRHNGFVQPEQ